ncbi:hypothetical protein G3M48_001572 [Beauveria asiatica]|uniref:Uncharacterized protein n=1 Tax=Beauveria asiatica TaxID=1069075 RepID=A0AAW0RFY7_9HYPO
MHSGKEVIGTGSCAHLQRLARTRVICYDGDSARVAASVMRAMGYAANSLRGELAGLVTMLSTPQTCAKAGPEQQTSWLQLCEAQRAPAAAAEAPAAKSSSELLKLQQAAVTVNTGQLSSIGGNISAKGCE